MPAAPSSILPKMHKVSFLTRSENQKVSGKAVKGELILEEFDSCEGCNQQCGEGRTSNLRLITITIKLVAWWYLGVDHRVVRAVVVFL